MRERKRERERERDVHDDYSYIFSSDGLQLNLQAEFVGLELGQHQVLITQPLLKASLQTQTRRQM